MSVLSLEEFNRCSTSGATSLEKICKGRTFIKGPVFSLANLQSAKLYCEALKKRQNGSASLIVKEKSFLQIWSENKTAGSTKNVSSSKKAAEISLNSLPVEPEFIQACKEKLAIYIGPIAPMVCKITLTKKKNLTRATFVEILAKKISDPDLALKFAKELLE